MESLASAIDRLTIGEASIPASLYYEEEQNARRLITTNWQPSTRKHQTRTRASTKPIPRWTKRTSTAPRPPPERATPSCPQQISRSSAIQTRPATPLPGVQTIPPSNAPRVEETNTSRGDVPMADFHLLPCRAQQGQRIARRLRVQVGAPFSGEATYSTAFRVPSLSTRENLA